MITAARDTEFVAYAPGFDEVTGASARLTLLAEVDAHEGPVYFADENALYFTTLPRLGVDGSPSVQIKRLPLEEPDDVSVLVAEVNGANGMTSDRNGRLIVCEQGNRWEPARISRLDRATGERERLVEDWRGLPLNSPNDVVVASDGAIWFTDPSYGHLQGFRPQPKVGDFVYRHDPATGHTACRGGLVRQAQRDRALTRRAHAVRHRQRRQPGARQLPRRSPAPHQGLRRHSPGAA